MTLGDELVLLVVVGGRRVYKVVVQRTNGDPVIDRPPSKPVAANIRKGG